MGASDSRRFPPSPFAASLIPLPWKEQEALSMLLASVFHLVILTQAYLVKSKEPSPNSYACGLKQAGENFIPYKYIPPSTFP